jgi:hypothetical protein
MTTNEEQDHGLQHYRRMVARCTDIIRRVEEFAEARGIPVGNGPVITLARQLLERNQKKVNAALEKRGIL